MFIMAGMPGGRHFNVLSEDESPAMRALEMACHFARYSGVSFGALAARPRDPSESGAVRVGGGSGCPGAGPPARGGGRRCSIASTRRRSEGVDRAIHAGEVRQRLRLQRDSRQRHRAHDDGCT